MAQWNGFAGEEVEELATAYSLTIKRVRPWQTKSILARRARLSNCLAELVTLAEDLRQP